MSEVLQSPMERITMTFYFDSEESFRVGIKRWLLNHTHHLRNSVAVIGVRHYRTLGNFTSIAPAACWSCIISIQVLQQSS